MKIIFLTSRFPYPLEKGDKLRAYYQIEALSHEHEVHLISITDTDHDKQHLEKLRQITTSVHLIRITPLERYLGLIRAVASGLPFQIAWFYSPKSDELIQQICQEIQPDHIFCQLPRMAEYCTTLPHKKTLDYMDSFGIGMQKRSSVVKGLMSALYKKEAVRMIRYEALIAKRFDHLTIISQQDKEQFSFGEAESIHVVPNGISPAFFDFPKVNKPEYDVIFVGNMGYLPNIETVEFLINDILPLLPDKTKVIIAGANPSPRVKKLASPQVFVSGWVDDIRTSYVSGRIFVAPMWSGTGQQNKILEAMALGIPCITTQLVNNAIGAQQGKEILIAESATEFANAIQLLLKDQALYHTVSTQSSKFVQQKFDWKQNATILSSIFASN